MQYLAGTMSGFGNFLNIAKDFATSAATQAAEGAKKRWDDFKAPRRQFEPMALSADQLKSQFTVVTNPPGSLFSVHLCKNMYHVVFSDPGVAYPDKFFSVCRDTDAMKQGRFRDDLELHKQLFMTLTATDKKFEPMIESIYNRRLWSTFHHSCAVGHIQWIKRNPAVQGIVNALSPDGELALNLACARGHSDVVRLVLALGGNVKAKDSRGQNALHAAALDQVEIIKLLGTHCAGDTTAVNALDVDGYTALVLAIFHRNPECVAALLHAGADPFTLCHDKDALETAVSLDDSPESFKVNETLCRARPELVTKINDKTGDTVLHSIKSKKVLSSMLAGVDLVQEFINVVNKNGDSALHQYSAAGNVACMVALLAAGAKTDVVNTQGDTSLHLAALNGCVDAVKTLIVFGADQTKRSRGLMPIEVTRSCAVRAIFVEYHSSLNLSLDNSASNYQMDLLQFAQNDARERVIRGKKEGKKYVHLLSLDGGGVRGLVLIQILLGIEERLKAPVFKKFQWVGGTSTGAILAIALSTGKSLRDMQRIYFRFKDVVFEGTRPYDATRLETFLKDYVGVSRTMNDIATPKLFVTATKADKTPITLHVFRNYKLPISEEANRQLGFEEPNAQVLWKAARASCAAPTYFKCAEGKLVDGGLIANNPALDLLADVHLVNTVLRKEGRGSEVVEVGCVVSLGCGVMPDKDNLDSLDVALPENFIDAVFKSLAVKALGNMLIDHITGTDGRPVDRARSWCTSTHTPYYRFSPDLKTEIELDSKDDVVMIEALWQTVIYMHIHRPTVDKLVQLLAT